MTNPQDFRAMAKAELVPMGRNAELAAPGDFILCHRKGVISWVIRTGEAVRYPQGAYWSHAALVEDGSTLIEMLAHGGRRTPLGAYRDIEYVLVRTNLDEHDAHQACEFMRSCLLQQYGYLVDLGIALRYLTPGRGLWFGMNGTEVCSGAVAQAQVRGWANFTKNPSSMSPTELSIEYDVPPLAELRKGI